MNNKRNNNLDKKKITRFSIRTYKGYGAASIIVSAFFLFLNQNHIAQASEIKKDMNTSTNISHINSEVSSQLQSNNTPQIENSTSLNDTNIGDNVQLNNTSTDSNKSLASKLANQPTQQNSTADSIHNQNITHTQHNSQSPSVNHRIHKRSVNTNPAPASNNDPLHFNETNTAIENGHFDHVTGGSLPTTSQKVTFVTGVDHWTSLSTNPNPEFPIFNTLTARDYRPYMSDASAPYGVVLAVTTNGNTRTTLSPKVAGIYQDISVVPGSELVVRFTSASMTFKSSVTGAKLKISDTTGNQILFDNRLNGMSSFPTGKLSTMVNIPDNLDRVRVTFLPISDNNNLTSGQTSSANGYGSAPANIYYGGVVSNVSVNSGAFIETSLPQTSYTVSANSATANVAQGTVSFNLENKGHTTAKNVIYKVTLPANSKFISATGAQGSYDQTTNVLTLTIGKVGAGQSQTISYIAEFQASEPKNVELNGNLTYQTDAPFRGKDRQKTGEHAASAQTVQLLMYQTDLQTKVNDITQQLHTLNEADYTPESWNALKAKIVEANNILNEENNHIDITHRQNQASINQMTTELQTLFTQLKETTPASPSVTADEATASVLVTPKDNSTSMTIKYVDTAGIDQIITATKTNNIWSLNPSVAGMSINDQSGAVTINHTAVKQNSEVIATAVKGNSDSSSETQVTMPIKEGTPAAPIVTADEPTAGVVITPQGDITEMTIKYTDTTGTDQTITATKVNNTWSLNPSVQGISIDSQTGVIDVDHTAVQPYSEVIATAKKGNSDVSGEHTVQMPVKETTPAAPTVTADEATASVIVTPQGDTSKMTIEYTDTTGTDQTITATNVNNLWSLKPAVSGISINNQTGVVTIDHTAVQPHSDIKATAVKGNSDVSEEHTVQMSIKEATPAAPIVAANGATASVTITPQGDTTSMTIKYVDTTGAGQTITAMKANNLWVLNPSVAGIMIDDHTGVVTVEHTAVQPNSEINVIAVNKNSDPSQAASTTMHAKMATPQLAAIIEEDTDQHITMIRPPENVNQLMIEIDNTDASTFTINAVKQQDDWQLVNNQYPSVHINPKTGEVTISGDIAQFEGTITATVKNGNSDGKSVTQTLASEKFDDEILPILHVTVWVDTEGNILKDPVEDDKNPEEAKEVGSFKGYQYIGMEMKDGITRYIFKKLNSVLPNDENQATNHNNNQENHHVPIINQNNENHSLQANNQNNDTGNNQQTPAIQNNEHNNSQNLSNSNDNNINPHNKVTENSSQQDNHSDVISNNNNSVHGSDLTHVSNNTETTNSTGQNEPLIWTSQPEDGINAIQQDLPVLHVTVWMDTKGQILKDPIEDDKYPQSARQAGEIPGYRFLETMVKDGITIHIFEKVANNHHLGQRKTQVLTDKETLTNIINQQLTKVKEQKEVLTVSHNNGEQVTKKEDKKKLPQTGQVNDDNHGLMYALMSLLGLSLIFRRKHKQRQ
ncbi:SasC/FmtB family protein [Staphylococcus simiae]|uniref:SasC/FmtB family protein n=1 Tax=Staphylococcus simiae TaxID=308354 RepID=UPI001A974A7E|nr:SasC/FmtB family protein [Staphylococcus simiae]QSY53330.1 hypothetical protein J3R86_08870 [Staphylococcus simiae]